MENAEVEASMTIAFATGVFDLLHVGHVRFLQAAREQGDVLIVCVSTDDCKKWRPGREDPVIPFEQRCEMVAALSCVDIVIPYKGRGDDTAIEKHGASIRVVTDLWPGYDEEVLNEERRYHNRRGVKYVEVSYTRGVSSTLIKTRIRRAKL